MVREAETATNSNDSVCRIEKELGGGGKTFEDEQLKKSGEVIVFLGDAFGKAGYGNIWSNLRK